MPLVVASNRDERLSRPAEPPSVRTVLDGAVRVLSPRDVEAGGTWLGLNAHGVFVGITNRYDPAQQDAQLPGSRGQVVLDALAGRSAREAADRAAKTDPAHQGPFHLVMADRSGAFIVWSDTERLHHDVLAPGIVVVTERSFDAAPTGREPLLATSLADVTEGPRPSLATWRRWLSQHDDAPLEGTCVHAESLAYGTRSGCVVTVDNEGRATMAYADGPPCTTPYVEQDDLVAALMA